jgi:phenylalanyl-tRNA synthetase beta chain
MEKLIGKAIGGDNILSILKYLDYEITDESEKGCVVSVPMYRVDVTRECDVVEDVLRIYGYNNIDLPERMSSSLSSGRKPDPARVKDLSADFLVNNGFYETMNNSLTKSEYYDNVSSFSKDDLVMVMNPLSSDLDCMRQTLLFNGLEVIAHNINRQHNRLKIFEFGNVYSIGETNSDDVRKAYKQKSMLSCFVTGPEEPFWRDNLRGASYFALKGYVEALFRRFGIDLLEMNYSPAPSDIFSEGLKILTKGGKELAVLGSVKKKLLKQFDIKQSVYASEINWDLIFKLISKQKVSYSELPKYPSVTRDLALLLDEGVSYSDIYKTAFSAEKKLLKRVVLFDVYRGDKIPEGKKQYAVSFTLRDDNKTLTDKYVEKVMGKLLNEFSDKFGASLR